MHSTRPGERGRREKPAHTTSFAKLMLLWLLLLLLLRFLPVTPMPSGSHKIPTEQSKFLPRKEIERAESSYRFSTCQMSTVALH
jgi:hypothetical protein